MASNFLTPISLGTQSVLVYTGNGSPEGTFTAPVGSLYLNATAAGASTVVYVKSSGSGNTGWSLLSAASVGGSDTQVLFNDSGSIGGDSQFTWNKTSNTLTIDGSFVITTGTASLPIGSSTSPSYSFNSDSNTGIYSSAADKVDISAGGSQIVNFQLASGNKITTIYGQRGTIGTVPGFGYRTAGWDLSRPVLSLNDGSGVMHFQGNEVLSTASEFRFKVYNNNSQGGSIFFHINNGGEFDPVFMANQSGLGIGTINPSSPLHIRASTLCAINQHTRQLSSTPGLCGLNWKFANSETSWTGNFGIYYVPNGTTSGVDDYWGKIHISARNVASTAASVGTVSNAATFAVITVDNSSSLTSPNVGIATVSPTARLHLPAGTSAANTAPIKLTSGTNLTSIEAGVFEYDGAVLYFSPTASVRTILSEAEATPTIITSNQDNYNIGNYNFIRLSSDAYRTISGFSGGYPGRKIKVRNVGTFPIWLYNQSVSSLSYNRISFKYGNKYLIENGGPVSLIYDGTSQRWIEDIDYTVPNTYSETFFTQGLYSYDNFTRLYNAGSGGYVTFNTNNTTGVGVGVVLRLPEDTDYTQDITILGYTTAFAPSNTSMVPFAYSNGCVEFRNIGSADLPSNVAYNVKSTTVTVDFGSGSTDAIVNVTGLSWVTSNTRIVATLTDGPSGRSIEDGLLEGLTWGVTSIVAGVGFTFYVHSPNGQSVGQFNFYCIGV